MNRSCPAKRGTNALLETRFLLLHIPGGMGAAGGAEADLAGRQVAEDARSRPDDGIGPDRHPGSDKTIRRHPGAVTDRDRGGFQAESGIVDVVATRTQIALLGNHAMLADFDAIEAVQYDIIPDPTVIPDRHFPRVGNSGGGANNHVPPHFGPKPPQNPTANPVERVGGEGKCDRLHQPPQQNQPPRPSPVEVGLVVLPQIDPGFRFRFRRCHFSTV